MNRQSLLQPRWRFGQQRQRLVSLGHVASRRTRNHQHLDRGRVDPCPGRRRLNGLAALTAPSPAPGGAAL